MIVSLVALVSLSGSFVIPVPAGLIEKLDNSIRLDLQNLNDTFFAWVMASAFVVVIGCAMEGPEIIHELWPKVFTLFSGRWVKKVGLIGWLLVVLGVAGEGVFEVLEYQAEGQLQTFNDILLKDARLTSSVAKQSAIDAANAAEIAIVDEKQIRAGLGKAISEERAARKHLDIATGHIQRLERQTSWRWIDERALSTAMKPFSGTFFIIRKLDNPECDNLAQSIALTLESAGWKYFETQTVDSTMALDSNGESIGVLQRPDFPSKDSQLTFEAAVSLWKELSREASTEQGTRLGPGLKYWSSTVRPFSPSPPIPPGFNVVVISIGYPAQYSGSPLPKWR